MEKLALFVFVLCSIYFSSCTKDTCNSVLGDTFESIDRPTFSQGVSGVYLLNGDMQTMDKLTDDYFAAVTIIANDKDRFGEEWQNDDEIVAGINFERTRYAIEFKEKDFVNHKNIALHFRLRDREEFIDCEHGGSGDSYYLNIQFSIHEDSNGELSVTDFEWEEEFSPGPY